ncbi:MAG: type IV pilus secretin PilQ [Bacteriovoracaceae bacterium]|nr:type IV pilus secretin PilQ [Bacteriovoracaceae bacterium]
MRQIFLLNLWVFFSHAIQLHAATVNITGVKFLHQGTTSQFIIEADAPLNWDNKENNEAKQFVVDVKDATFTPKILRPIDTSEFSSAVIYVSGYGKGSSDVRFTMQLRGMVPIKTENQGNNLVVTVSNGSYASAGGGSGGGGGSLGSNGESGSFSSETNESSVANSSQKDGSSASATENEVDGAGEVIHAPKSSAVEDILENVTMSGKKKFIGKKISINVKSIKLADLLKIIADTSGFNIFVEEDAASKPPMTLTLNDVPWDEALDTILTINKLVATKYNNVLTITTIDKALSDKKKQLEDQKTTQEQIPLVSKIFSISYAQIDELIATLKEFQTPIRGKITKDNRTNRIIVKDTAEVIEKIKKLVELLDTATPQILIEAKIVVATESFLKDIGFGGMRFGYNPLKEIDVAGAGANSPQAGFAFNTLTSPTAPSLIGFTIDKYKRLGNLNLQLKLMESQAKVKIVSSPRVITQNKQAASLTSSDETSYVTTTVSNGVVSSNYSSSAVSVGLSVTPQVTNDGGIAMTVNVTKSSFGARLSSDGPPNRSNNTINTNVLVDNGSTVVLGGLYEVDENITEVGVPWLKDIPVLGWLFKNSYNPSKNKKELLVFITPRIINQEAAGMAENDVGTESVQE